MVNPKLVIVLLCISQGILKEQQHDWWFSFNYCNANICFLTTRWSQTYSGTLTARCQRHIKSNRKLSFFLAALWDNVTREINKTWRKLFISMWCFWKFMVTLTIRITWVIFVAIVNLVIAELKNIASNSLHFNSILYILHSNPYTFCIQIHNFCTMVNILILKDTKLF